jgi:hypothetical protein
MITERLISVYDKWEDVTIDDYQQLQEAEDELAKIAVITSLQSLNGIDENSLEDICKMLAFIQEPPTPIAPKFLFVNGNELELKVSINDVKFCQFYDLQGYQKQLEENIHCIISLFCIPKGKKYNEDYDIFTLQEEIRKGVNICQALGIYEEARKMVENIMEMYSGLFSDSDDEEETTNSIYNKRWGWLHLAVKVKEVKSCQLDDVWDMPILEFMNMCAYVKETSEMENNKIQNYHV